MRNDIGILAVGMDSSSLDPSLGVLARLEIVLDDTGQATIEISVHPYAMIVHSVVGIARSSG
jgi:hypothetical protein